jgi:hypothetical protein
MPKLPSTQDFTRPSPQTARGVASLRVVRPTAAEIQGGAVQTLGNAVTAVGEELLLAQRRIQNREDAIALSDTIATVNKEATEFMQNANLEGDLSNKSYRDQTFQELKNIYDTAFGGFQGSDEAKARLSIRLTGMHARAVGTLSEAAVIISNDRLQKNLQNELQPLLDKVKTSVRNLGTGGHSVTNLLKDLDAAFIESNEMLADVSGNLNPIQEDDLRRGRAGQIALTVFDTLLERGDVKTAETILLKTPQISNLLTKQTRQDIRGRIADIRFKQGELRREFNELRVIAAENGYELTPERINAWMDLKMGLRPDAASLKTKEAYNLETGKTEFATEAEISANPNLVPPSMKPKEEKVTGAQRLAAGFALRANQAGSVIDEVGKEFTGVASRIGEHLPQGLRPQDRQRFDQAQRNFTNAILRRESGAAIAPSEFESAAQQYFPRPGDGQKVLQQKAQNRRTVINALQLEAGPAFEELKSVSNYVMVQGQPMLVGSTVKNRQGQLGRVEQDGSITILK